MITRSIVINNFFIFSLCTVFRDSFLKPLTAAKPNDYDDLSQKLDVAGNTLDYRKYGDSLFEILIIGGILGKLSLKKCHILFFIVILIDLSHL